MLKNGRDECDDNQYVHIPSPQMEYLYGIYLALLPGGAGDVVTPADHHILLIVHRLGIIIDSSGSRWYYLLNVSNPIHEFALNERMMAEEEF